MIMPEDQFEQIVSEVLDGLPDEFLARLNNLAILVADFPSPEQLAGQDIESKYGLLGLYEGYVQSRRTNVGVVLPDKITIFRIPICQSCSTAEECRRQIEITVKHEIAHHFGSGEKGARQAGRKT